MLTVVTEFLTLLQERLYPLYEDTTQAAYQTDDIRQAMLDCAWTPLPVGVRRT